MSKTTIIFHADATNIPPLVLEVEYTAWAGEPMVMYDRNGGGYPGSPPGVEVSSVVCIDIDDEIPGINGQQQREIIGGLCWLADRKQIETKVMEAANEQAIGDPDRNRE